MSAPATPPSPPPPARGPVATGTDDLLARALAWAEADPDPATAAQVRALAARAGAGGDDGAAARADLADRFCGTLAFGTAGLRGALGGGPNRMNRVVVLRAAAGLAAHLLAAAQAPRPGGPVTTPPTAPTVVIGHDARHGSAVFARDTAAVMTGAGVRALLLPRALPTPVLAFAVRHLAADAGVMVTASHNPPADNGYKVYLGGPDGGAQIVPPSDGQIAARIAAVGDLADLPRPDAGWEVLGDDVLAAYLAGVSALPGPAPADGRRARLSVVVTPMHGVGGDAVVSALAASGTSRVELVPEQAEPDPDFPTVAFPNPEEPGAMDLALALARRRGADLLIAVDPDADRCAVGVPLPAADGASAAPGPAPWRMLSGDELGAVLGERAAATAPAGSGAGDVLACSLVSSRLLARIAAAHGLGHAETLTGFKWISRAPDLRYGYEEAIGYCVAPHLVRDKDGISAAVVVAALAADLAARGRTLLDVLDDLARAHGVHASGQVSFRVGDLDLITDAMARLRAAPPRRLAGSDVVVVDDLARGSEATTGVPPTDGLRWLTATGARVVVRPSGTEPKLKCYLEVVEPVAAPGPPDAPAGVDALPAARARAARTLARLREEVLALVGL